MMDDFVEIVVDVHEKDSCVFEAIANRQLGICKMKHLETADIVLRWGGKTVAIEVKRGADFQNSLHSGRLHDQLSRLRMYDFPILIIEDWHPYVTDDNRDDVPDITRRHKMTVRTLNRKVTVYETAHLEETCDIISELVRDLKDNRLFVLRRPVIIAEGVSNQMKVLCALPSVKETIAERILDKFGTVSNALANLESWLEIDRIGPKKLEKIRSTLEDEEDE